MEETDSQVRKTRSAKVKNTPPPKVAKAVKNSPKGDAKPGPRRTRKKVVLMEVEVSDDEDETIIEQSGDDRNEINESELEDKLLASPEGSNDETDKKGDENIEIMDVNGDNISEKKSALDDSITVVFNDIEMLQSEEEEGNKPEIVEAEKSGENDKKGPEQIVKAATSPEMPGTTPKVNDSPKKVIDEEKKTEESIKRDPMASKTQVEDKPEKIGEKAPGKNEEKELEEIEPEKMDKKESTKINEKEPELIEEDKLEINEEKECGKLKENEKDKEKEPEKTKDKEPEKAKDKEPEKAKDKEPEKAKEKETEKAKEKEPEKAKEKEPEKAKEKELVKAKENEPEKAKENDPEKVKEKELEKTTENESDEKKRVERKTAKLVIEIEKTPETEKKIESEIEKEIKMDVDEEIEVEEKKEAEEKKQDKEKSKDESVEKMEVDANQEADVDQGKSDSAKAGTKDEDETTKELAVSSTSEEKEAVKDEEESSKDQKQNGDPDAENISEDELPGVPVVKVPEAEEVSDEELPGPKRAELPADTEVVSEDELPTVKNENKKEGVKRKINETDDYDPGSPTSESEVPTKKPALEKEAVEKEEKPKPKKLPELDKYWKAVNDDPTDFTGWTYLLQYVDQENDMEAAREAYDAFLSHYPYCYGYWRKYADYEKRKGNKKKCEEVFERGLKAIPLSVDLWIHYLTYVKTTRAEEEDFIRSQFDRALAACGLEFRSDRLWDSYIKWETEGKRLQKVTGIYDKLLATPTQGYTTHFDNFQEHVASNPPNKVIDVDEFLALRKEVRNLLKHDTPPEVDSDAPPGDEDQSKVISSDEETKSIRERIVSIRRKIHKGTVNAVTARWNYEEGIKRPYFHVKPLERCQLKNWHDYLDYETEQGDRVRIIVLFERCLIACALYEEFWLKFVLYLENLKDPELQSKIRDVYERACTIHHLKKPNLHLQWAMFEEIISNPARAAEILVNLEKTVPNVLQIAYRRINLERRRGDHEKCTQLYEHYISNSKNKMISSNIAIKYSRFCFRILKDVAKAQEVLKTAITKDPNNPRLYLQLIDLTLQKDDVTEKEVIEIIDSFLEKETVDIDQKTLFAQRKLEYLEDFGAEIQSVQQAHENYQKLLKLSKENNKKKEVKTDASTAVTKKEKPATQTSSQASNYANYAQYGNNASQPPYAYSGQQGQYNYTQYGQGGEQYQYQNWQYPQSGYGGYNQWGSYSGGYGY